MDVAQERRKYSPDTPSSAAQFNQSAQKYLPDLFPRLNSYSPKKGEVERVGVLFSGGQAPGGHNVIASLFDALDGKLFGFLNGPKGLIEGEFLELNKETIDRFRNMGGFDMIGSGRDKIEKAEDFEGALKTANNLKLDGIVIIGGDDSNTNAAFLAEYFLEKGCKTRVIGVPKTIDGDLKNSEIEVSFGFDTATKVYSEMIGNIAKDAISSRKYYHFIKLMGRSASHVTLECALQTHPNYAIIAEERQTLDAIISDLEEMIIKRAEMDHHFGVILIPEGLIEFIPDMDKVVLPKEIQDQLLLDKDPHGNIQLSHVATERLILLKLQERLKVKFSPVTHFLGYEGRSAMPSNFDATYCHNLGKVAHLLLEEGYTGQMAVIKNLAEPVEKWVYSNASIISMMGMEMRKGKMRPVIHKSLVDLHGAAFKAFKEKREEWKYEPCYQSPGPIQFFGPKQITDCVNKTLLLEKK
jgi:pyrophosphate--fructose-6-phosphate 1-phosphotransferase